jgi:hypothetical protein
MILAVLGVGILINFRQVLVLSPEVNWIEAYRAPGDKRPPRPPRKSLLGSMARMLDSRSDGKFTLSTLSLRTLLDAIRTRLDESRDLSRYFIGLLVFLGLLGTFWGLLDTLRAVGNVISGLSLDGTDTETFFRELRDGLEAPLGGMGTAFSSSLFGLAGAVVLGFIDLQAGTAQNRFYNDLEEWLSGQTRLASGKLGAEGDGSVPAYVQALLEETADSIDQLQRTMARAHDERRAADERLADLSEELAKLSKRMHEELSRDRAQLIEGLREEIRLLTRTIGHSRDRD